MSTDEIEDGKAPSGDRRTLLELLAQYAYQFRPEGFTLVSGKTSQEYLDCKMALSHAEALPSLGKVFLAVLDERAVGIGGLTMGADPIAISTAAASAGGRSLCWFSVRKEAKEHGRKKLIEGDVPPNAKVVVVDDVVTSGGSTIQAIQKCRDGGLQVVQVLVLVDREEDGGLARIEGEAGAGVPVRAIFKKSEIRAAWEARRRSSGAAP
jgi:orotate phosphoribosyltransferase